MQVCISSAITLVLLEQVPWAQLLPDDYGSVLQPGDSSDFPPLLITQLLTALNWFLGFSIIYVPALLY